MNVNVNVNVIDLIIGATLMNAMPHLVLGIWKGRMFSIFGFGNLQNILYGVLNLAISISLFAYQHGIEQLAKNHIYAGALALLVIYFLTGRFWYLIFHQKHYAKADPTGTSVNH